MEAINADVAIVIMCLIAGDVITGIVKGIGTGGFRTVIMKSGAPAKIGSVFLVLLAAGLTIASNRIDLLPEAFSAAYVGICAYLAIMETGSILENIVQINPELDRYKIFQILGITKDQQEDKEEEIIETEEIVEE